MPAYLARRLPVAAVTLLALSFTIFGLGSLAGDPSERLASAGLEPGQVPTDAEVAAVRHELGLDRPLPVRYAEWFGNALRGDLGRSVHTQVDVAGEVRRALPATVRLAAAAMVLIVVLSIPLGLAAAMTQRHWPDHVLRLLALTGASTPGFFLAYVLVFVAAVRLQLLPVVGMHGASSFVLPALTLAVGPAALVSRLLRSSLLDVLGDSYIVVARAKGLAETAVMTRHALRNAALPVLTVLGTVLAGLVEGTVIVELIFAWPGIGQLTFDAVSSADYPLIQGTVLFAGLAYVTLNLVVDILYAVADPRTRPGEPR